MSVVSKEWYLIYLELDISRRSSISMVFLTTDPWSLGKGVAAVNRENGD